MKGTWWAWERRFKGRGRMGPPGKELDGAVQQRESEQKPSESLKMVTNCLRNFITTNTNYY